MPASISGLLRAAGRPFGAPSAGAFTLGVLLICASPAAAQGPKPIGGFVVDVRGAVPIYGQDPIVAANLDVPATTLPERGLGIDLDAHWYWRRRAGATLGFGVGLALSRGRWTSSEADAPGLLPVETRFAAVSPQVSLNFGSAAGWSYLSGGMGFSRLRVEVNRPVDPTVIIIGQVLPDDRWTPTINYGGGARWFTNDHLAFCVDVRFYLVNATPTMSQSRFFAINVGVGIK